jgi:hypothetical protein
MFSNISSANIEGVLTGDCIYWTLIHRTCLSTLYNSLQHALSSQPAVSSPVVVWQRLPTTDVPLPLCSRTIPVPQLPASNSNSSQRLNRSSPLTHSLTNQLTSLHSLTPKLMAMLHQTPALLTAVSRLLSIGSWPSLYRFGTDRTENISSNGSDIVACVSVAAIT